MFVQVFQGGVKDPEGLRASLDRWITDLGPEADGWLGTTWGLYGDNEFIALARFASADAAKRNSERPEQGTWWAEVESSLEGETRFSDYDDDDVILLGPGGSLLCVTNHQKTSPPRFRRQLQDAAALARCQLKIKDLPSGLDCPEALEGPHPSKSLLAQIVVSDPQSPR